jgi:hypothetical protein
VRDPQTGHGSKDFEQFNYMIGRLLPRKFVELVGVALNAACTNLNPDGTRRHIRAALDAAATRDEILMILKMASVMSIHSCSPGAPILLEEAKAAGATPSKKQAASTPACDKMKAAGQWNTAWDPFLELRSSLDRRVHGHRHRDLWQ